VADRLGVRENNIGNGGKYKKRVKIKTQKTKLCSVGLQRETNVKVVANPPTISHIIILMLFLIVLILCYATIKKIEINCKIRNKGL
jgi:hypothetical protein